MTTETLVLDPACSCTFGLDETPTPCYTKFVINAGYAESTRAASLELRHVDGFTDILAAMKHLAQTIVVVSERQCRDRNWNDPERLFLNLHIEELDIINADGIEEQFNEHGWYIFPDWIDDSAPVYVQNFIRLLDNEGAYIQWQTVGVDSNSFQVN